MGDWGERDPQWQGITTQIVEMQHPATDTPIKVHLLRAGGTEGTPTVLLHGLAGSRLDWLDVIVSLAADGPVVAVDLPGFGRTAPPNTDVVTLRQQARFLQALLDELALPRVRLHGNSMGGVVAVMLAAAAPARVAQLVLTAPALPPPWRPGGLTPVSVGLFAPFVMWRLGAMAVGQLYRLTPQEQIRRLTVRLLVGADADDLRPTMRDAQLEDVRAGKQQSWRAPALARGSHDLMRLLVSRVEIHQAMAAVTAPTLVLHGEHDRLVSRAAIDAAMARCPHWSRIDLDGVGHVPMLKSPGRWLQAVSQWEEGLAGAPPAP